MRTCCFSLPHTIFAYIGTNWFSPDARLRRTARGSTEISRDATRGNRHGRAKKREEKCNETEADLHLCYQMCEVNVRNIHKGDDLKSVNTQLHPGATDLTSTFWVSWLKTQMWVKQPEILKVSCIARVAQPAFWLFAKNALKERNVQRPSRCCAFCSELSSSQHLLTVFAGIQEQSQFCLCCGQTISLFSPVCLLHGVAVLALPPYYPSIILISLPSPFHVFLLTIIPSIKPGWPPTYRWRASLASCRVYSWVLGGGWDLAAEGDPCGNRGAPPRFSWLSLGREGQTTRFHLNPNPGAFLTFLFYTCGYQNQPLSMFYNSMNHEHRCVTAGNFSLWAITPPRYTCNVQIFSTNIWRNTVQFKWLELHFSNRHFKNSHISCCI